MARGDHSPLTLCGWDGWSNSVVRLRPRRLVPSARVMYRICHGVPDLPTCTSSTRQDGAVSMLLDLASPDGGRARPDYGRCCRSRRPHINLKIPAQGTLRVAGSHAKSAEPDKPVHQTHPLFPLKARCGLPDPMRKVPRRINWFIRLTPFPRPRHAAGCRIPCGKRRAG